MGTLPATPPHLSHTIGQLHPHVDVTAFASLLQRCTIAKVLCEGERAHQHIVRHGFVDDRFLNNLLVQMYGKCGSLQHARAVFDNMFNRNLYSWNIMLATCAQNGSLNDARAVFAEMPQRDVVSWSAMIAAFAQNGHDKDALQLFYNMQAEGFEPDEITFISVLNACASMATVEAGREVHARVVGSGCESHIVVGNALVNMYGKCRSLEDARAVFSEMPRRDVVTWSAMITARAQTEPDMEALQLFHQMQSEGFEPDKVTFICILDACASMAAIEEGKEIHTNVVGNGWESDVVIGNALINMYGKCCSLDDARALFTEMPHRDVVLWSTMIAAYTQNGKGKEALQLFGIMQAEGFAPQKITFICILDACARMAAFREGREIHASVVGNGWESDVVVGTALIDMYGKCRSLDDARAVFSEMPLRNVVSWSAMIGVCARNGHGSEALGLFAQMQDKGFEPNKITFICLLDACASMASLDDGREVHVHVVCNSIASDLVVGNALVTMYGKCGNLDDARAVFLDMPWRDLVSWNAIITGCSQNGHDEEALHLFHQMKAENIKPNEVTFIGVLTACSHMGMVADARHYFKSMIQDHNISPSVDHYVCIIDLFGRAGQLDKVEELIKNMPCEPISSAWLSMLSSCRIHGDVEGAVRAANRVFDLDEKDATPYVLLANIHATAGTWDDVEKL